MTKPFLTVLAGLMLILVWGGCGGKDTGSEGVPTLNLGQDVCMACGMKVSAPLFAAVARDPDGETLAYDAIECLVRDLRTRRGDKAPSGIWLPDFAAGGELRPVAEMTVVLADFASPMGGGYAAFSDATRAATEATQRHGVAGKLEDFVAGTLQRPQE